MTVEDINLLDEIADKVVVSYSQKSVKKREVFELILLQNIIQELKEIKTLLVKVEAPVTHKESPTIVTDIKTIKK